jgi:hypothetical protein
MTKYVVFVRHTGSTAEREGGTFTAIGPAQAIQQYLRAAVRVGECPDSVRAIPLSSWSAP